MESLTKKMIQEINDLIAKIDEMGGAVAAIEKGLIQREIESRAYAIQKEIEERKRVVVGVNEYKIKEDLDISIFKPDPEYARSHKEKLVALKKNRDQGKVQYSLEAVRKAAEGEDNLMPHFIEAAKVYATLGEICGVLREVFGEYRQVSTVG